jgi:hypothetical protein
LYLYPFLKILGKGIPEYIGAEYPFLKILGKGIPEYIGAVLHNI